MGEGGCLRVNRRPNPQVLPRTFRGGARFIRSLFSHLSIHTMEASLSSRTWRQRSSREATRITMYLLRRKQMRWRGSLKRRFDSSSRCQAARSAAVRWSRSSITLGSERSKVASVEAGVPRRRLLNYYFKFG